MFIGPAPNFDISPLRPSRAPPLAIPLPLIARSSFSSAAPCEIVRSNARAAQYFLWAAELEPERICRAALLSYCAHVYAEHVGALGHDAFARLFDPGSRSHGYLREGLAAFGSHRHRTIFEAMERLPLWREGCRATRSRRARGRAGVAAALDKGFAEAQARQPLADANALWLRTLRLEVVEDEEFAYVMRTRAASQPRSARVAEPRRQERLRNELARQLCLLSGRFWVGWIGVEPKRVAVAPGRFVEASAWLAATSRGPCVFYFVEGRAVLADGATTDILARLPMPF